ncbi:unnamed protein product, partial [Meganyctiphanes norvegica]
MDREGGESGNKNQKHEECHVCQMGTGNPGWASINRGILVCDECCSVHRSLGRHISHVKSLKKGTWNPTQLAVSNHSANNSGANHIWEHTLLDPGVTKSGRRKPSPKDPVHPTKADFIRAKHQMLSFVYRPPRDETISDADADVSRQLHASVRTANLETSLRLLSQGADPNYYHKEKGCCPLHVAARAGQAGQVELLMVYGADPGAPNSQRHTPEHFAREAGYSDLADHLVEYQYELTDRLAFYLCGRKPDHSLGQHWIIPEMADSLDLSDLAKEARVKLQNLPNHLFEELACDVYDEVDRRETDAIWLSLQNQSALVSDRCTVPFLPVNPDYSSTRNQGRQKLARFNAREFATLIIDVLSDAKRRQTGIASPCGPISKEKDLGDLTKSLPNSPKISSPALHNNNNSSSSLTRPNTSPNATFSVASSFTPPPSRHSTQSRAPTFSSTSSSPPTSTQFIGNKEGERNNNNNNKGEATPQPPQHPPPPPGTISQFTDDGEPLYDSVASEDDYSYVENMRKLAQQKEILAEQKRQRTTVADDPDYNDLYCEPSEVFYGSMESTVSLEEYHTMKEKLESSDARIQALTEDNQKMRQQLDDLTQTVRNLTRERAILQTPHSTPQRKIRSLREENNSLRNMYGGKNSSISGMGYHTSPAHLDTTHSSGLSSMTQSLYNGDCPQPVVNMRSGVGGGTTPQRPFSMFEPRVGPPKPSTPSPHHQHHHPSYNTPPPSRTTGASSYHSGDYDNTSLSSHSLLEPTETTPLTSHPPHTPSQEEVVRKTEVITKRIQELLISAQEGRQSAFIPCAEQINSAVLDMDAIFPKNALGIGVQNALRQLVSSATRLQNECNSAAPDPKFVTQQVIQCAYD